MDCWKVPAHRATCQESEMYFCMLIFESRHSLGVFHLAWSVRSPQPWFWLQHGWVIAVVFSRLHSGSFPWKILLPAVTHVLTDTLHFWMVEKYFPFDNNCKALNCRWCFCCCFAFLWFFNDILFTVIKEDFLLVNLPFSPKRFLTDAEEYMCAARCCLRLGAVQGSSLCQQEREFRNSVQVLWLPALRSRTLLISGFLWTTPVMILFQAPYLSTVIM